MHLKFLIFTPIITLAGVSSTYAKECEVPVKKLEVGSITVLENLASFKKRHAYIDVRKDRIDIPTGTDYSFSLKGVMYVTHIEYDSLNDRIIGFSLTYANGKYGDFDTPIDIFKKNVLSSGNLPKKNWVLKKENGIQSYQYECSDYKIFINQDSGRSGPIVNLFTRYSEFF